MLNKSNLQTLSEAGDDLSIPENIMQLLEDVPEELHVYIIEEILADIFMLDQYQDGKSKIERAHSQKEKLIHAISKKRNEVASINQ